MEQRVNIKFCFKLGRTATETHEMLLKVDAVSKNCVFEWFKRFRDGKEDVKDEPRSSRPPTSTSPDNIERVRRMLADDSALLFENDRRRLKINLDITRQACYSQHAKRKKAQERKKRSYPFPFLGITVVKLPQRVTTVLRAIPKVVFADGFQQLYKRCQKCIVTNGDYFECQ
ncbi:hypothetical protein AVEN_18741-1 [Araneus ventricosus]|uniref:Mos1 transposase HTH domain-containing protein n=1 Tax=Araneus ventricosus TaxID=182803 RepID=A0A4Y2GKU5_ARAVE|nr:hypothetical protein AVEN_18741-1 [Araneus ventricosus]